MCRLRDAQSQFSSSLPRLQGSLDLILNQIVQRRQEGSSDNEDTSYVFKDGTLAFKMGLKLCIFLIMHIVAPSLYNYFDINLIIASHFDDEQL